MSQKRELVPGIRVEYKVDTNYLTAHFSVNNGVPTENFFTSPKIRHTIKAHNVAIGKPIGYMFLTYDGRKKALIL